MSGVTALRPNEAQEIGGYRLLGRLGEGGMGTVYLAESPDGGQVAIKIIRDHLLDRDEFRRRFQGEVERAKNVPPFCTAEVLDADTEHDPPYLVVEYVDGPTLGEIVRDSGPLSGARLHSLGIGVATALTAIHGAGVIHRDLKPGNVLLPRGGVKVIDFGLARDSDAATGITRTDQVMGTVPYIAPERLGGTLKAVTAASDVFAWGAVMVYAATGHTPFGGDTPATTAIRILTEEPNLNGVTGPLRDIVARTLEKNPNNRPTARELLDLLISTGARSVPKEVMRPAQAAQAASRHTIRPGAADLTSPDVGTTADVPVPPGRRRGRSVLIGLMATVAIVAGVAVAAASGLFQPLTVGASGPSASTSATVTGGPEPTPSQSGFIPAGLHLALKDTLRKAGYWGSKDEPALKAACHYDQRGLVATVEGPTYRCPGPKMNYGDVAVIADVALLSADTCAGIWFRYGDSHGGYALEICSEAAYFVQHHKDAEGHWTITDLGAKRYDTKLELGQSNRFTVAAKGGTMTFHLGNQELFTWSDTMFTVGRICLGVLQRNEAPEGSKFSTAFSYVEVWGASPASPAASASNPATSLGTA
jgi:eukaryotic-like serine/threonine-protein kinase